MDRRPARRGRAVTAKNANPSGPVSCFKCKSPGAAWVAVEINRYVGACPNCFDSAVYWAALCNLCGAPRYEHGGEDKTVCPVVAIVRPAGELMPQPKALEAAPELDALDVEEVDLDE